MIVQQINGEGSRTVDWIEAHLKTGINKSP